MELSPGHLTYMNIGRRYWEAELDKLTEIQRKPIRGYVRKFPQMIQEGVGLFIWGENGTGKSYIVAALLKFAWRQWRVSGYCLTAADLKEAWIHDKAAHFGSEETVLERIIQVRLLAIDDIGKEHRSASGFAENRLGALLRDRSRAKKTTIITSNLNPREFKEIYGESTGHLAKECLFPVILKGGNMRDVIANRVKEVIDRG